MAPANPPWKFAHNHLSLSRCDLSGFRLMMLKKCICRLKSLNTSQHREKLLKLKKYSGKICINWVVHWYVQHLSFTNQIGIWMISLSFFSLYFASSISVLFHLCPLYSLPFVWSFQLRVTPQYCCGYGGKCSYSSEMMLKRLGVTRHEVCNVLSNDSKKNKPLSPIQIHKSIHREIQ